jgi:hypothetical protein
MQAGHTIQSILDFYAEPGPMTSAGVYAARLQGLPRDVADLARVAQGVLIHEHIAGAYGVTLTEEDRSSVHIRPVEGILERVLERDDRPLTTAREPAARLPGNCRHFSVLMAAMLRAQGVPARARCGFGGYFVRDRFEDHWVCEHWNAGEARWALADAQIDDVQRGLFHPDFDLMDVPRDRFVIAGDAWARCRAGEDDPAKYGLSFMNEAGLWWIASNLVRDVAALRNREMLPWDVWGGMVKPDEEIDDDRLQLFDRLAALTGRPDAGFDELGSLYEGDDRLRVPATVFNAVLQRMETV